MNNYHFFFHPRANGDGATVPAMKTNYWTGLSIVATTVTVSTMTTTPGDLRVNVTQATQPIEYILVRMVLVVKGAPDSIWFRLPRHRRVF